MRENSLSAKTGEGVELKSTTCGQGLLKVRANDFSATSKFGSIFLRKSRFSSGFPAASRFPPCLASRTNRMAGSNRLRRFLRRQRAIHRSRLRGRNPVAYRADYLRVIHAHRITLGWVEPKLYSFAEKELALKKPLTSLLALGPLQLKALAGLVRREAAKAVA
ncbi:hypothetical protein [Opitutus sp. GAS368]|uniref:hypothetical protein n=1 Tax=Opitutus sp. GAS368 TaxID=1882749 RepID=UPI001560676F|nr:hypothetical protein [Opitutus sp. GAS368]